MVKCRIAVLLPILALAVLAPVALGSGKLSGTYKTKITSPPMFKGTWKVSFKSGHVTARDDGHVVARNTYTISGSTITLAAKAGSTCKTPGKYTFTLSGKTLKFTKIADPCQPNRAAILKHTFTKV